MSRSTAERLTDILDSINRARVADKRMGLGESLGDEVGVQVAYQAILHNLFVIGEAVGALPDELLARDPGAPWQPMSALAEVTVPNYQRIPTADIHRTVDGDLESLEGAVRRLRAQL